jgi:putative aldouronate transport system permease protein
LATIGLFLVLGSWNDWYQTLLYIDVDKYMKLQYLLLRLMKNIEFLNTADAIKYGAVREGMVIPVESARMAMCVLAAGPILVIFPFFQKYFVRGITIGSVKG